VWTRHLSLTRCSRQNGERSEDRLATILHTAFYFPFPDRSIRFDVKEPMGALGDMAWYSMSAMVKHL
jgi:hypothetical protein